MEVQVRAGAVSLCLLEPDADCGAGENGSESWCVSAVKECKRGDAPEEAAGSKLNKTIILSETRT